MKLLKDYSEKELIALTEEEKASLYLLELAHRGITLPSAMPEFISAPDKRADLLPDLTVYRLSRGYNDTNLYFKTEEEATKAIEMLVMSTVKVDSSWSSSGNIYYEDDKDKRFEIKTEQVYSANKYAKFKAEIEVYESQKSKIEHNNVERENIISKHQNVMGEIDEAIAQADRNITKLNSFKDLFDQYRKMANGDEEIAIKFLLSANYAEISEYSDSKLEELGLSKAIIDKFNKESVEE